MAPSRRLGALLAALLALCLGVQRGDAISTLPYNFVDEQVLTGFVYPTDICFLPKENGVRFIITEKNGYVKLIENDVLSFTPFIDITKRVNSNIDRGLLSCGVDPDFADNHYVFFNYVYEDNPANITAEKTGQVARVTANEQGISAPEDSLKVIMGTVTGPGCDHLDITTDVICCESFTHASGGVTFDQDGNVFFSFGDGGFPTRPDELSVRAQNADSLNGKIVRVTRDGLGVPGNPFFTDGASASSNRAKIWTLGSRNSWRLTWDDNLGAPLVGEVGWASWEEVNVARGGNNFGWPCHEALEVTAAFAGYPECKAMANGDAPGQVVDPVVFWPHTIGQASSGVLRVKYASWPAQYRDWVYYTDYVVGWMKRVRVDSTTGKAVGESVDFASELNGPVQLKNAPQGDALWYLAINAQELRRIRFVPDNSPPSVASLNPPKDARDVQMSSPVVATFSKQVTMDSLQSGDEGMRLIDTATGLDVLGSYSFDASVLSATFQPNTELRANAQYQLYIGGDVADPDGRKLYETTTVDFVTGGGYDMYISDMYFTNAENGLGPVERDESNGDDAADDGVPIVIRGVPYAKGIGVVPLSSVQVVVPEKCRRFEAVVGIDDSSINHDSGSAVVSVIADGRTLYDLMTAVGEPLNRTGQPITIDVDVTGTLVLTLLTEEGDSGVKAGQNQVSWASARLRCGRFDHNAPHATGSHPENGAVDVDPNGALTISFSEAMDALSLTRAISIAGEEGESYSWSSNANGGGGGFADVSLTGQGLDFDEKYTVTVSTSAQDISGNALSEQYSFSFTTASPPPTGESVYFDELNVASALNNGGNGAGASDDLAVLKDGAQKKIGRGLRTRADAELSYDLNFACSHVYADVGVDAQVGADHGSVRFKVEADGKEVCESDVMRGGDGAAPLTCNISPNTKTVKLITGDGGDGAGADDIGVWGNARLDCAVGSRDPVCVVDPFPKGYLFKVGDSVDFSGSCRSFTGDPLPADRLSWQVVLHHCQPTCHVHPYLSLQGETSGSLVVEDHGDYIYLEFQLTGCDDKSNACADTTRELLPLTTPLSVVTQPQALLAGVDSLNGPAPLNTTVVVNADVSFSVVSSQGDYTFSHWEGPSAPSGNKPSFSLVIPDTTPITMTAVFSGAR